MQKNNNLFRKVALDRLSSPDQLDRLMQVTNPRGWVALLAISSLLVAFAAWSFVGRIRTTVEGQGLLLPDEAIAAEVIPAVAPAPGEIDEVLVEVGQTVEAGTVLVRLQTPNDPIEITSPITGRVVEIIGGLGDRVGPNAPIVMILANNQPFIGKIYVPFADAQNIKPGMEVEISPVTVPAQEFGFILGTVIAVGEFPATDENAQVFAGEDEVVIEVQLALETDSTPTGYKWSFADGPDSQLRPNTPSLVKIIVQEERPIVRVFPVFEDLLD